MSSVGRVTELRRSPAFDVLRVRSVLISFAVVLVAVLLIGYAMFLLPMPPERTLSRKDSPDGTRTATYSWRPSGICGAYSKDGAHVYLTIRDRATDRVIARHSAFADVPEEAERRLAAVKPW